MSDRLEKIDGKNWQEFVAAPLAVLMLGKTDCPACQAWTEELGAQLADAGWWPDVRFGKMLVDQPGLASYKKANPWLAQVDSLPFNLVYVRGERVKSYAGGGIERLANRLQRIRDGE